MRDVGAADVQVDDLGADHFIHALQALDLSSAEERRRSTAPFPHRLGRRAGCGIFLGRLHADGQELGEGGRERPALDVTPDLDRSGGGDASTSSTTRSTRQGRAAFGGAKVQSGPGVIGFFLAFGM